MKLICASLYKILLVKTFTFPFNSFQEYQNFSFRIPIFSLRLVKDRAATQQSNLGI